MEEYSEFHKYFPNESKNDGKATKYANLNISVQNLMIQCITIRKTPQYL